MHRCGAMHTTWAVVHSGGWPPLHPATACCLICKVQFDCVFMVLCGMDLWLCTSKPMQCLSRQGLLICDEVSAARDGDLDVLGAAAASE
jgi:hypothetical protein